MSRLSLSFVGCLAYLAALHAATALAGDFPWNANGKFRPQGGNQAQGQPSFGQGDGAKILSQIPAIIAHYKGKKQKQKQPPNNPTPNTPAPGPALGSYDLKAQAMSVYVVQSGDQFRTMLSVKVVNAGQQPFEGQGAGLVLQSISATSGAVHTKGQYGNSIGKLAPGESTVFNKELFATPYRPTAYEGCTWRLIIQNRDSNPSNNTIETHGFRP